MFNILATPWNILILKLSNKFHYENMKYIIINSHHLEKIVQQKLICIFGYN